MDVLVGVDTGDDTEVVAICDGGHAALSSDVVGVARTAGTLDKTGSRPARTGASSVTFIRPVVPRAGPTHSADRSDQGHQSGLADLRVRPMSETLPASYTTAETVTRIIPADLAPRRSALTIG
jgi:hypothetical protein